MSETMGAGEAERSLLGACMAGWSHPGDLDVEPEDFYEPKHADVWAAILRVERTGTKPDAQTVRLALAESEGRKPDPVWLIELAHAVPLAANAPAYASEVRAAAASRALESAGIEVQRIGARPGDLERRREEARKAVDDACRGRDVSRARWLADSLDETLDKVEAGQEAVLSTPWVDIDRAIGGLAPGRLIVIGARPGGGKSIAGTNLALHVAHRHHHAALIASLEMPEVEVNMRLLAAHAGVDLSRLMAGTVTDREWEMIRDRRDEMRGLPITTDDRSDLSVQQLRKIARDVQRQRDDLALIVVDYLQLMRPAARRRESSRAEEVSGIARDLKLLARETGACVVAMAQVNREGGKNAEGPRLTDIRDGGAENDADQVILLHRPDLDIPEVTATVAKNRHGPVLGATLQMQGHYARLASVRWEPTRALEAAR